MKPFHPVMCTAIRVLAAWSWTVSLVAVTGCEDSTRSEEVQTISQAATFPVTSSWVPVPQAGASIADPLADGMNNGREVVGTTAFPAVYIYADGTDFFVRMRVDDDPGQSGSVKPFGWGLLIDTNGNFAAYEYALMVDGTGNPKRVLFAQNTSPGTTGDPSDVAELELSSIAINTALGGNLRISAADSSFNGTLDYFLDYAVPLTAIRSAGISLSAPIRFIAGTSSSGNSLSVDIAGTASGPGPGVLAQAVSDQIYLDGSSGDVDLDGVSNPTDLDDDNDGIPDSSENALGLLPDADRDSDGIPNWRDANDTGNGSASGCIDTNADGLCEIPSVNYDQDRDGVPNHLDVDSDNDGILDSREAGHRAADANGDGLCDGPLGANGFVNTLETSSESGVSNYVLLDTDNDEVPDYLDVDSDGDGSYDLVEVGRGALDGSNGDGRIDTSTTDVDKDGLRAAVDANNLAFGYPGVTLAGLDSDGDGIPAPYDPVVSASSDSDSDGRTDAAECIGGWPCPDVNGDGTPDYMVSEDPDGDGVVNSLDSVPNNSNVCRDVDLDECDDCTNTGANGSGGNVANDGLDTDLDGRCNAGDPDDDNDGVPDQLDSAPTNPLLCRDVDADSCDDCSVTGANGSSGSISNDGPDFDGDWQCDIGDSDDDNDGVADVVDLAPENASICRDVDTDGCDDCSLTGGNSSGGDPLADGPDFDADGLCDTGEADDDNDGVIDVVDVAPSDPTLCRDEDADSCDDCSLTGANQSGGDPLSDGTDTDSDGTCDVTDADDDNDGVADGTDAAAQNAFLCRDVDADGCDDCSITGPNGSGGSTMNDGIDRDADGQCDATDPDVDNDGVPDVDDTAPFDATRCRDVDADQCDDCAVTAANGSGGNVLNDGIDTDHDGRCNDSDADDDDDGVTDSADREPLDEWSCTDADTDTCDDCSNTGANGSGGNVRDDGTDSDADGRCDAGDPDDDNDGVIDSADLADVNPNVCRDVDSDGCDDCSISGPDGSGGNPVQDGADLDGDGMCDLADPDTDNDGVPDLGDSAPADARACRDLDDDGCDDCAVTGANGSGGSVNGDGPDQDADGACDLGDIDDDNDGVLDGQDLDREDPRACRDVDTDGCDDCSFSGANGSGGNVNSDGIDTDADGVCDLGDGDDDGDGVADGSDSTPTNPNACRDADADGCDDCSLTGANGSGGSPTNDGLDLDGDGQCDVADPDVDNDGVPDLSDVEPQNPNRCRDADGDGCDDCTTSGADGTGGSTLTDGVDFDSDGTCDDGDLDDDQDGVPDGRDSSPRNPLQCSDEDADSCDDCGISGSDGSGGSVTNDGLDSDSDGKCDVGDLDDDQDGVPDVSDREPLQSNVCRDVDQDTCDDCATTGANGSGGNPLMDGPDSDGDGLCNARDDDDDNDGVADTIDTEPTDPSRCRDSDSDECDDCSRTLADASGGSVTNDGADADVDGLCDKGDPDDDNDGVKDVDDLVAPTDPSRCRDSDSDGCDDCSKTGANGSGGDPANDGDDLDADGRCDGSDPDIDNDGVDNLSDGVPNHPNFCRDVDGDGCDDCSATGANSPGGNVSSDGPDSDGDGRCDVGDLDDDNDGVCDSALAQEGICGAGPDSDPTVATSCRDADLDGCNDCSVSPTSGGDTKNDGPDLDGDGACDAGDPDDDDDGVPDQTDVAARDPSRCRDVDRDTCDDCSRSRADRSGGKPLDDGTDLDGDGTCDLSQDADDDGIPLLADLDADNDGVPNVDESELHLDPLGDNDADSIANYLDANDRGDGQKNGCQDVDTDGRCERPEESFDVDQDGTPNFLDLDSDGDHIYDAIEAGHDAPDGNQDGRVDGVAGANGLVDVLETSPGSGVRNYELSNVDEDALPDLLDTDADGDSLSDAFEARDVDLRTRTPDSDGDGKDDYRDHDADDDRISDGDEAAEDPAQMLDTDRDDVPDYLDEDSDGDGLDDIDEAGDDRLVTLPIDTDEDGKPNFQDVDSDGDGIEDGVDTCLLVKDSTNRDSDADGMGDVCEADRDGDSVPDDADNCPSTPNNAQEDEDDDGAGDPCDIDVDVSDEDGDGVEDADDNCPKVSNRKQTDSDGNGKGNACDTDNDGMTLEGGGCSTQVGGSPRPGATLVFGLLALALRRSMRRRIGRGIAAGE